MRARSCRRGYTQGVELLDYPRVRRQSVSTSSTSSRRSPQRENPLRSSTRSEARFITVSSTTSTQDSGLFGHLLPIFTAKTGIAVRVVAQGTGQALDTARRGDADVGHPPKDNTNKRAQVAYSLRGHCAPWAKQTGRRAGSTGESPCAGARP